MDDDVTLRLQSGVLPLEVQLMLLPMWTVRSKYHDCMRPLDNAMEGYMKFRSKLKEIDLRIELGSATNTEIAVAFDQVYRLLNIYEKNQKDLQLITREVHHQIIAYAHASKNDLLWNEMVKLRDIDQVSFSQRTCTFEHVVTCLFKLDENIKESLRSCIEISKCCANYLLRITEGFNFTRIDRTKTHQLSSLSSKLKERERK